MSVKTGSKYQENLREVKGLAIGILTTRKLKSGKLYDSLPEYYFHIHHIT